VASHEIYRYVSTLDDPKPSTLDALRESIMPPAFTP
jgi:hypothetical protein